MDKMLEGKNILIVEDEAILALDLRFAMEDMGASVLGPCHRLSSALRAVVDADIDGAILDVDVAGEVIFPLADTLSKMHVPFVFHTGRHNPGELSKRYVGVGICTKPTTPEDVARTLMGAMQRCL